MSRKATVHAPLPGAALALRITAVPQDGTAITVRFLGNYLGIHTHWSGKSSVPCCQECPNTLHRGKVVWKGFGAVERWRDEPYCDWEPTVLEITERLDESLYGLELRGQVYQLGRTLGAHSKPEVTATHLGQDVENLSPCFDARPVVERMYRPATPIVWGLRPLCPPRMFVSPVKAPRPPFIPSAQVESPPVRSAAEMQDERLQIKAMGILMRKGRYPGQDGYDQELAAEVAALKGGGT